MTFPVHAGFMNAVAVLLLLEMGPLVLGMPERTTSLADARPLSLVVAMVTVVVTLRPPLPTSIVPAPLVALLAGGALHHVLRVVAGQEHLGPTLGTLDIGVPQLTLGSALQSQGLQMLPDTLPRLLPFALALTLMSTLQGLLAFSLVDNLTRRRRDSERELLGQGLANLAAGLVGAMPGAASAARSVVNLQSGGTTHRSRLAFATGLLLIASIATPCLAELPIAVIGGLFCAIAIGLVDLWSRRSTVAVLRKLFSRPPRACVLVQGYAVMLVVAAVAVFSSLLHGVAAGIALSMAIFVQRNSRKPVRNVMYGSSRHSLKVRPAPCMELLRRHGARIALLELDGALFFGTADAAARHCEALLATCDFLVVDFRRVKEIDPSGARVLLQTASTVQGAGKRLLLAALNKAEARETITDMDAEGQLDHVTFFADVDAALEAAEDALLASLAFVPDRYEPLQLSQTSLCVGLEEREVALLASLMETRRMSVGGFLFRRGDPGDSLYVSLQGRIAIRVPNSASDERGARSGRRLVSFAPGVVFGEMGLLQSQARSAHAVAEDDGVVLSLSRSAFDELAAREPVLLGKLMLNLSIHLSSRVRTLTQDLEAVLETS